MSSGSSIFEENYSIRISRFSEFACLSSSSIVRKIRGCRIAFRLRKERIIFAKFVRFVWKKIRRKEWISVRANFLLEKMRSLSKRVDQLPLGLAHSFQTAIDRFQFARCLVAESCQIPICRKSSSKQYWESSLLRDFHTGKSNAIK